ncbi:MAG: ADP-ribosylglycohydrolase family protein [Candidatus Uhrbacteria bacterium]
MDRSKLRSHVRGCFLGIMYGDAIGLPWETKKAEQILAETNGLGVTGPTAIPKDHFFKSVRHLPFGSPSDDWALTSATARAYIAFANYRSDDVRPILAREFAHELLRTSGIGWGKGTKNSVREMDRFLRGYADGRSPMVPTPLREGVGSGNGVLMRIAPCAIVDGTCLASGDKRYRSLQDDVFENGAMTHGDPRASIAAYSVAWTLSIVMLHLAQGRTVDEITATLRKEGASIARSAAYTSEHFHSGGRTVSDALNRVDDPGVLDSVESLAATTGTSTLCWESAAFSIGVFLRNLRDPRAAILEAINAGGDTDSNASIVGGLVGLLNGEDALPKEWLSLPATEECITLADRLVG